MRACHLSICTRHDFDACAARFTPVLRLRRATGRARDDRYAARPFPRLSYRANQAVDRQPHQSRAIALDMESAAIAANGFRFRVPYGTLLCVSDRPLHGEIKLAGMAGDFYRQRVSQHLEIGLKALEKLKTQEWERLHSRKLRSFAEVAFQ